MKNPKETAFLVQYGLSIKKAETLRHKAAELGIFAILPAGGEPLKRTAI